MTEEAMHAIQEKSNDQSYPSERLHTTIRTTQARHTYRFNSGTGIMGVTNHLMIGFKAHFITWNLSLALGPRTQGSGIPYDLEENLTILPLNIHSI